MIAWRLRPWGSHRLVQLVTFPRPLIGSNRLSAPFAPPCLRRDLSVGRDSPRMAHLLFLSHAVADTERARHLADAIESCPPKQVDQWCAPEREFCHKEVFRFFGMMPLDAWMQRHLHHACASQMVTAMCSASA